jgi:pantoate--beta-alanine ligase
MEPAPKVIKTIREMQAESNRILSAGKTIGFVPTMGYLHEGHLSLIRAARKRADVTVLSIYVNPTQFGPTEDLAKYPRDFERDEKLAAREGVDIIFYPTDEEMYPEGFVTTVHVNGLTEGLCGASRPGHFDGVTTVCTKLFNAVKPDFAVFGQKDAQQALVIRQMVRDLNLDLEIVIAPIVRESDGLAMSSRNVYLSPEERQDALSLSQSLKLAERLVREGESDSSQIIAKMRGLIESHSRIRIDYIVIVDGDTLQPIERLSGRVLIALAVFAGKTRLIDNILLDLSL